MDPFSLSPKKGLDVSKWLRYKYNTTRLEVSLKHLKDPLEVGVFVVKDHAFVSPQSRLMARLVIWQGVDLVHRTSMS